MNEKMNGKTLFLSLSEQQISVNTKINANPLQWYSTQVFGE